MEHPLDLAIIIGSTREGRLGDKVGAWFARHAEARNDVRVDVIDLAHLDLPAHLSRRPSPAADAYRARLAHADAFVVVTPEYNHSFPAGLKQAIDLAYAEWAAKPVAFVSYGGVSGGLRAVEHLRHVFAEVHATTVRDTVSLHNPWTMFNDDGWAHEETGADVAAKKMLDRLVWWGEALRAARAAEPYAA